MKPLRWSRLGISVLALAGSTVAAADERPVQFQINGGYSVVSGTTSDYLEDGWIAGVGVVWHPRSDSPLAFSGEIHYSDYNASNSLLRLAQRSLPDVRIDDGDTSIWGVDANAIYYIPFKSNIRGYLIGGIGEYKRKVRFTQTVLVGGVYCDPWWGYCYQGVVPGDAVVADQSTTRFAWNAGLGVEFAMSEGGSFFVAARYHQLQTSTSTEFIPIQIGYRF